MATKLLVLEPRFLILLFTFISYLRAAGNTEEQCKILPKLKTEILKSIEPILDKYSLDDQKYVESLDLDEDSVQRNMKKLVCRPHCMKLEQHRNKGLWGRDFSLGFSGTLNFQVPLNFSCTIRQKLLDFWSSLLYNPVCFIYITP